jgi:uncharacterized protein
MLHVTITMNEEISFLNIRGKMLSAYLNNGRSVSPIIIMHHGFASNKNQDLFLDAEKYFERMNYNIFRYDVEGAGDSQGDFVNSTLSRQVDDLTSAIDKVCDIYGANPITVLGFSLGAAVAALANDKRVSNYVFWSPALYPNKDMFPRYQTREMIDQFNTNGYIMKDGLMVGKNIIEDFRRTNLEQQLELIDRPVLLVHGSMDARINYHNTVNALKFLKEGKLFIIDGANHSYKNNPSHRAMLFDRTYQWLDKEYC